MRVFSRVAGVPPTAAPARAKSSTGRPIVVRDAKVPLPRGTGQGHPRSSAHLQVRLPRRSPLEAQIRAERQPAHLRTEFRGLSVIPRSEEHTSELQSRFDLVCRLLLEKKRKS